MTAATRSAIVTGGGTGIGRACCERLAADGYRAVAVGLDRDDDLPTTVAFHRLDVTDAAAMVALAATETSVAVVVNAAGIILHDGREFEIDGFRRVMDVNVAAAHLTTMAFRGALAAHAGAVVNIASMWSFFGSSRNPAYATSKGAVVQLTRSLAVALAPERIRVNAVAPGWIDTRLASGAVHNPERAPVILARIPMGRFGQPADVGKVVSFLASENAGYVTGAIVPVDGGYGIA